MALKPTEIYQEPNQVLIRFHSALVGENAFKSIESAVKDAVARKIPLTIDLAEVQRANADFFAYLMGAYVAAASPGQGLRDMRRYLTLIVTPQSPVYDTAHRVIPHYLVLKTGRYVA